MICSLEEGFKFHETDAKSRRGVCCGRSSTAGTGGVQGWKPKAPLRVLSSRGNERRVGGRYEGRTNDNAGRDVCRRSRVSAIEAPSAHKFKDRPHCHPQLTCGGAACAALPLGRCSELKRQCRGGRAN